MEPNAKWDTRFLTLARTVADWSKDPSTQVGAVIVRPDRTIASVGYNGFPRGCDDVLELLEDRPTKYMRTVHAEVNAIISAREPLHGCTLYVWPLHPCANCTGIIIQSGISRIVAYMKESPDHWEAQFKAARKMCVEAGMEITLIENWEVI
jgi:dCMP deaminase